MIQMCVYIYGTIFVALHNAVLCKFNAHTMHTIPLLEQQVRDNPDNGFLFLLLGSVLLDSGAYDRAIAAFESALESEDSRQAAEEKLVLAYLASGRTAEAVERMETAGGSSPEFYNNAGIAFADQGQEDRAIAAFESALRLKPDFEMARRNLARIYARRAQELVAAQRYVDAEAPLREAVELYPERESFGTLLGVVLSHLGRDSEAVEQYRSVLSRHPEMDEVRGYIASSLNNMGVRKIDLGDWQGALADFDAAIQNDPESEAARENRRMVLWRWAESLETLDPGRSLGLYEAYLREDPLSSEGHVRMGVIYAVHDDLPRAIQAFEKGHSLAPDADHIVSNLKGTYLKHANQLEQQGQHAEAVSELRKGLALDPDYLNLYRTLGLVEKSRGRFEEAAQAYVEILARDPEDEWAKQALTNLALTQGNSAYARGDYVRAIAEFDRVPDDARPADLWTMLGYLYLESDQLPEATDALGQALFMKPTDAAARQNLEACLRKLNDAQKSIPAAATEAALFRAKAFRLTSRLSAKLRAGELREFSDLLNTLPDDAKTVGIVQECALRIAQAAYGTRPQEAIGIAQAAIALGPKSDALVEWLGVVAEASP